MKTHPHRKRTTTAGLQSDVPPRWRWHHRQLVSLHEILTNQRGNQLKDWLQPLKTRPLNPADTASDEFDHHMALGILSHEQDALYEVNAAIQRILDGTYGTCELSGNSIPEARLRAVPWTRYTRESMESLEKQRGHSPTRLGVTPFFRRKSAQFDLPDPELEESIQRESRRLHRNATIQKLLGDPSSIPMPFQVATP